ncbi:MAG: glucose 1-dehydrogenase [Pseudomonadota bacterium]|nr:glucose 1-dehydrogenase [Pseudomonadota bacterium]
MGHHDRNFTGKVAFVTGGGTGIGRAAALAFAHEGANVAVVGRTGSSVEETVSLIEEAGGKATGVRADISKPEEIETAIKTAVDQFGRIDFAFNNAGIEQPLTPLHEISDEDWERLIAVDLSGVFHCMKQQIPLMLKQGSGVIVNTSSGAGVKGFAGQAAYCAAKWGLIGLSKAAALDYAKVGIRVNVIAPGFVDTPMMERFTGGTAEGRQKVNAVEPVGRPASPEEIAAAVLWLCSDQAAFVVGHALVMDGGQTV